MTDFDVVIVGAGAAGVGAGLALQDAQRSFVILEAQNRIGGRAYTDTTSMALPWDHGCHWMHCANVNPLVGWAERLGANYVRETYSDRSLYYFQDHWVDADWLNAADQKIDDGFNAVYAASRSGRDVAISKVLADAGPQRMAVRHLLQLMASADPEHESTSGYGDYVDTEVNWPVASGYGDLIERMARNLPVRTETPVSAVREIPGGVEVETPGGTLKATAAIVTASTSVLNSGAIRIDSASAEPFLSAAQEMPCGAYEKVAIGLRRPLPGIGDVRFFSVEDAQGLPINVQTLSWSDEMVIVHVAGGVARAAFADGPTGLEAYATDRLQLAFGSDILSEVNGLATTSWQTNSFVKGAYSAVRPGHAQLRRDVINTHTGRVGFAGEALSLKWQATAHGAYQSGQDVAARLMTEEL